MQDGFQNWKKGPKRLERHENECHREALHKLNRLQGPSVVTQLNSEARRIPKLCTGVC